MDKAFTRVNDGLLGQNLPGCYSCNQEPSLTFHRVLVANPWATVEAFNIRYRARSRADCLKEH